MKFVLRALVGAFLLLMATAPTAVFSQSAGAECIPVPRVISYLEARGLDYVVLKPPAIRAWTDYLLANHSLDFPASLVIVAFNPETGKGVAAFAAEGAVCVRLDFDLETLPVALRRA